VKDSKQIQCLSLALIGLLSLPIAISGTFPLVSLADQDEPPRQGAPAPDFTLPDLTGKQFTLSLLRGKVVFLNFWAIYCAPCRWELSSMEAIYNEYRDKDFEMLAVNVDDGSVERVKKWAKRYNLTFPILKDGEELPVSEAYRTNSIPTTLIIDKNGMIAEIVRGAREWDKEDVRSMLDSLLNEPVSGEKATAPSIPCKTC